MPTPQTAAANAIQPQRNADPAAGVADLIQADLDAVRPYDKGRLEALLTRLADLIPGCTSLRTDRFLGDAISESNPLRLVYDHPRGGGHVSIFPSGQIHGAQKLGKQAGLSSEGVREVADLVRQLADLNPLGAWSIASSDVPPFVVTPTSAEGEPITPDSYLSEVCGILAEEFTLCDVIRIHYQITEAKPPHRSQRRRAFLRFETSSGHELAAIDGSGIPLHARQQILKRDPNTAMLQLNLARMRYWAAQLGATPDHLAETFPILSFLTSTLHITEMRLRG